MNPLAPPGRQEGGPERLARRRRMRLRMLTMVAASYGVDTLLLAVLAGIGSAEWTVPLAYALATGSVLAGFQRAFSSGWTERFSDHYLTLAQMFVHAAVCIGFTVAVPQVGVLFMTVLFCIVAFCALRPSTQEVLLGASAISLAVALVIVTVGDRLAMPSGSVYERIVSALWISLMLGRCTVVGLYGARMRIAMLESREELSRAYEAMERLASRDELTGALNRRAMMELLEAEQQRLDRHGTPYCVALLDLDHFKRVNDVHGHLAGDAVLRNFTFKVAGGMRAVDRLGRYGGEEFLLFLQGVGEPREAHVALERARAAVAGHNWASIAPQLKVTMSAGAAIARAGEPVERLIERADQALYRAKREGRNRTVVAPS